MNVRMMTTRSSLTQAAVLEAVKILREMEGVKGVDFVEIEFAPEHEEVESGLEVATRLLTAGFGIKLSVHWAFSGTTRWAVKTENSRVVNEGLSI